MPELALDSRPIFPQPLTIGRLWPAGVAVVLAALASLDPLTTWEFVYQSILRKIPGDEFFSTSKQFVGATMLLTLTVIIGVYAPPVRRWLPMMVLGILLSSIATETFKQTFARARPPYGSRMDTDQIEWIYDYMKDNPEIALPMHRGDHWLGFRENRPYFESNYASYPSGHASSAFALAAFFCAAFPRLKWFWLLLAFGTAVARIRYRRHYPEDTLAGGALGWVIAQWVFSRNWSVAICNKLAPFLDRIFAKLAQSETRD